MGRLTGIGEGSARTPAGGLRFRLPFEPAAGRVDEDVLERRLAERDRLDAVGKAQDEVLQQLMPAGMFNPQPSAPATAAGRRSGPRSPLRAAPSFPGRSGIVRQSPPMLERSSSGLPRATSFPGRGSPAGRSGPPPP